MSIKTFDLVGTIHGREYTEYGEYASADDYRELERENEVLRKAAERYWRVREDAQQDVDGYNNETPVLVHAVSHTTGWRERIDSAIDAAISAHDAISSPENA